MNCFHFSVSLRYNTTWWTLTASLLKLWIAFIFLYLWDTTQPFFCEKDGMGGCELLSFFCIFEIQHNIYSDRYSYRYVVNCFHFSVSLRYNTTRHYFRTATQRLWIAFIFLYLWDTTQLKIVFKGLFKGCELLSFFCIFEIQHNPYNHWQ